MANDEFAAALADRPHPSLEPEPEQVAESQPDGEAQEQAEQIADEPEQAEADPNNLANDPRFREWQTKYDTKFTEQQKRIQELEAQAKVAAKPAGPTPEEKSRQTELATRWQSLNQRLEQAQDSRDAAEAAAIGRELGVVERDLIRADLTIAAREAGIDPDHPDLDKAIREGKITNPDQLQATVWRVAAQGAGGRDIEAEREALEKDKQQWEKEKVDELAKFKAELRQELGLNASPSATRGAGGKRAQLERQHKAAKDAGNFQEALTLKNRLAQLE